MKTFTNRQELKTFFNNVLKKVLDDVAAKIYDTLRDYIQSDIYDVYEPKVYERTYEFIDSWVKSFAKETAGEIIASVSYEPIESGVMSWNPDKYQHGNQYQDRRLQLAEILNSGLHDKADWDFKPHHTEPFFTHTLTEVSTNWHSWVASAFRRYGISIT